MINYISLPTIVSICPKYSNKIAFIITPLSDADFAKIEFFNPVGKDVVGVKEIKNCFLGFITYKHCFQSKSFHQKEDAIKWRLQKELELFGPEKAPQRYLFEKYQIKKEKQSNEKD